MARTQHIISSIIIVFFVLVMLSIVLIVPSYLNPKIAKGKLEKRMISMKHNFSSIVSLNIPSYVDDSLDRRFVCSGVIITPKWILVGDDCFLHCHDWLKLQVRAGSTVWSSGGTSHNVIKMVRLFKDGPAIFNVDPIFTFDDNTEPFKMVHSGYKWTNAYGIYWFTPNKKKTKMYVTEIWSKLPCSFDNRVGIMKEFLIFSVRPVSSPLLTLDGVLVGYKLGVGGFHKTKKIYVFLDLQYGEYRTWIDRLTTTGEPLNSVDDFEDNLNYNNTILLYGSNQRCLSQITTTTTEASNLPMYFFRGQQ